MSKEYRFLRYTFRITDNVCLNNNRNLYEIDDLKDAGTRPFLTSISDVKDFIKDAVDAGYWTDAQAFRHPITKD